MITPRSCRPSTGRLVWTAAAFVALAAMAGPAGAIEYEEPVPKPDLVVSSLSVVPSGASWSISYRIKNSGQGYAWSSTVSFRGTGVSTQRSVPMLAPGATTSGSLLVSRTQCYVELTAKADSANAVGESVESNNSRQAVGALPACPPRYRITAVSFKAVDESGVDFTGSDEPYWIFSSVAQEGTASTRASRVYGDVDSGETRSFSSSDGCIFGCSSIAGEVAPGGIGVTVQLWERDLGNVSGVLSDTADAFKKVGPVATASGAPAWVGPAATGIGDALNQIIGWAEDDLLGTRTYSYSSSYLTTALPSRGMSVSDTRRYNQGDATYDLTTRIARVV